MVEHQNVALTIMLKHVKLSNEYVRLHLTMALWLEASTFYASNFPMNMSDCTWQYQKYSWPETYLATMALWLEASTFYASNFPMKMSDCTWEYQQYSWLETYVATLALWLEASTFYAQVLQDLDVDVIMWTLLVTFEIGQF